MADNAKKKKRKIKWKEKKFLGHTVDFQMRDTFLRCLIFGRVISRYVGQVTLVGPAWFSTCV